MIRPEKKIGKLTEKLDEARELAWIRETRKKRLFINLTARLMS
jgi:hypothetical protein